MSHRWRFYKLICYLKLIGKTNINWEILGYIYLIVSLSVFITFFITLFLVLIDCFVVLSCFFFKGGRLEIEESDFEGPPPAAWHSCSSECGSPVKSSKDVGVLEI